MLGQGIVPRHHHPVADLMGDAELSQFLEGIRQRVEATLARLPPHAEFLRRYCPAPAPPAPMPQPAPGTPLAAPAA